MIQPNEYALFDAIGLAEKVQQREFNPRELIDNAIDEIERLNPTLNAVIAKDFERARIAAGKVDPSLPLAGVPYLLKDLNTWRDGMPATNGCRGMAQFFPSGDSELVRRLRAAGLIILGKTNTPEFGLNICTAPDLFGVTRNPVNHKFSAGGSSGGSAAAVASGMLPAAHATDSGGSIRIPASNCGLFGLKPSRARVPLGNDQAEGLAGFSTAHAITHSVRDSALLLDLTAGPMNGDVYCAPKPTHSYMQALSVPLSKTKIALCTEGFTNETVHSDCINAAEQAARLCESLGCQVEIAKPAIDGNALRHAFDVLFCANIANAVSAVSTLNTDVDLENLVEPATLACFQAAKRFTAADYAAAIQTIQVAARTLGLFFENFDILVTPTLANPPLPLGTISMQTSNWENYRDQLLDEIPFTPLFNATGAPAASIPLGKSSTALPIGVQVGAAYGNEAIILQLAGALEKAQPWHQRI